MRSQTEDAILHQLDLLHRGHSRVEEFVDSIAQLTRAHAGAPAIVSETLTQLRRSSELPPHVATLIVPFMLASETSAQDAPTMDHLPNLSIRSSNADTGVLISVGRVLRDRYVIEQRLGTGGKGTVFKALDRYRSSLPEAQQHVALKVLNCGRSCSEETIKKLQRELHCAQVLSHRNIVNVFELDRDEDVVFFTMEFLDGELLSEVMERLRPGAMRRLHAWQIIKQLGAALDHAHERGIAHGDLKPRNILLTRNGELRVLDFSAAQKIARTRAEPGQPDFAPLSGTPAYASCELLEGRAVDPRDDMYALACISYELLTGAHPFACRPATVARDFGIRAARPAGLTGRQWRTLQAGLSWHRAGRSMNVHTWMQRLAYDLPREQALTPLQDVQAASAAKPWLQSRAAAASVAVILIAGACIAQLQSTSAEKTPETTSMTTDTAVGQVSEASKPGLLVAEPRVGSLVMDARPTGGKEPADALLQPKPSVGSAPLTISVDGYHVSSGDRFVEIRVHRNRLEKNSSFAWWTEPATARPDVDYVHQAKAMQTFPSEGRSTRFYVKLLPESGRTQRDYFYVAIAQPGHGRASDKVTRAQIWLPREELQARR